MLLGVGCRELWMYRFIFLSIFFSRLHCFLFCFEACLTGFNQSDLKFGVFTDDHLLAKAKK
jgi:hypothetical protein